MLISAAKKINGKSAEMKPRCKARMPPCPTRFKLYVRISHAQVRKYMTVPLCYLLCFLLFCFLFPCSPHPHIRPPAGSPPQLLHSLGLRSTYDATDVHFRSRRRNVDAATTLVGPADAVKH